MKKIYLLMCAMILVQLANAQILTSEVKVEVTNNNYTGIGTTDPTATLSLKGMSSNRVLDAFNIGNNLMFMVNTANGMPYMSFYNPIGNEELIKFTTASGSFLKSSQLAIGSNAPTASLTLKGITDNRVLDAYERSTNNLMFVINTASGHPYLSFYNSLGTVEKVKINTNGNSFFNGGNIGIGTTTPNYKLDVAGSIHASGSVVWPDYVFEEEYSLQTLQEVENHILENGHLSNIPSAKEVAKEGVDLVAMDALLLQKIEELTLYVIDLNKQIQQLKAENTELKNKGID
uniref:hypothetical protein n=1 Tax=Fulvivirga sp. TaxID=1931237 RepID=UPI00404AAF3F